MAERINREDKNGHYSNKLAHFTRGTYSKGQQIFQRDFPDIYARAAVYISPGLYQVVRFRQKAIRRDGR